MSNTLLEICVNNSTGVEMPKEMTLAEWSQCGQTLTRAAEAISWAIGDWAKFGRKTFDKLKEFAEVNNLNYRALLKLSNLAESIAQKRRRSALTVAHHAEVEGLSGKKQDSFLEQAAENRWSTAELRRQIRADHPADMDATKSDGPALRTVGSKLDEVKDYFARLPPDWWNDERKQGWKDRLKPLAELYNSL